MLFVIEHKHSEWRDGRVQLFWCRLVHFESAHYWRDLMDFGLRVFVLPFLEVASSGEVCVFQFHILSFVEWFPPSRMAQLRMLGIAAMRSCFSYHAQDMPALRSSLVQFLQCFCFELGRLYCQNRRPQYVIESPRELVPKTAWDFISVRTFIAVIFIFVCR